MTCFIAASLRRFGTQEVPHKQKYHKLGFSSAIVAEITNVGTTGDWQYPYTLSMLSFLLKKRPTWETHDWPVVPCNASYALDGFPLPPSPLLCFWFSVGGGGLFFPCFVAVDYNVVKVYLPMAPVAVMLNLRADALTAACSRDYQRGRPTTGSKAAVTNWCYNGVPNTMAQTGGSGPERVRGDVKLLI